MRWQAVLGILLACGACYRPALEESCNVACSGPDGPCPAGLECGAGNLCKPIGGPECRDVTHDAAVGGDAIDPMTCYGTGLYTACLPTGPIEPRLTYTGTMTINTTTCALLVPQTPGPEICLMFANQIFVEANAVLKVVGTRPLVLVGVDEVRIDGAIDVASHRVGDVEGAGANDTVVCDSSASSGGVATDADNGGGGGAGGSFVGLGGNGGRGGNIGGQGGTVGSTMPTPLFVRGGCRGSRGGGAVTMEGGTRGSGGGGIYLISNRSLVVTGTINASGAAGSAGPMQTGGGGGGSGGFIGLDAPLLSFAATTKIFAIGGSGASGAGVTATGVHGREATNALAPTATPSGHQGGTGSAGAIGSALEGTPGQPVSPSGGGGGGGGGGGYIGVTGNPSIAGTFAPAPRTMP